MLSPEKENTYRALKGEPLLTTSLWCRFGIHKWTRWCKPKVVTSSIWAKQERECVACGEYEFKRTRVE